ncbi:hypothetical protein SAMN05444162_1389 [Paenibacillaceae bacterium GAS479]|nr:hypothetical protein SAMN05444162_1389 [Paenibacillaceae bacterium GAS479]
MDKLIYYTSTVLVLIMVWLVQEEFQSWDHQRQLLKNGNNQAVHTADDFNEGVLDIVPKDAFVYPYSE